MNKSLLIAALVSATLVTACTKKHDKGAAAAPAAKNSPKAAVVVDAVSDLEAKPWYTDCQTESGAWNSSRSQRQVLTFSKGAVIQSQETFENPKCEGKGESEQSSVTSYAMQSVSKDGMTLMLELTKTEAVANSMYGVPVKSEWEINRDGDNKIIVKAISSIDSYDKPAVVGEYSR